MVAVPTKFSVGVKITFVPLMLAAPFVGLTAIMVKVPPGVRTTSFTSGLTLFVVFCAMLKLSGLAMGGRLVTAVTTGVPALLVGFGSSVGLPPVAMLVTVPRAVEMTVSVRLVVAPAARLPRLLQMTWLLVPLGGIAA